MKAALHFACDIHAAVWFPLGMLLFFCHGRTAEIGMNTAKSYIQATWIKGQTMNPGRDPPFDPGFDP